MEIANEQSSESSRQKEGTVSRWVDWLVGSRPSQEAVRQSEAQAESNELLSTPSWPKQTVFASPEEEWRHDCLAFARVKNLQVVEDMHAFYLEERGPEGEQQGREPIVVAIGAHYKSGVASPEEVLLFVVKATLGTRRMDDTFRLDCFSFQQEMEKVGTDRPYILVYFHANTSLPTFPDTAHLQQIHAALHSSHKRNLKAFYVVHPTLALKYWIFMLRLAIPEVYGKVEYLQKLADLQSRLGEQALEIPSHIIDHDKSCR